MSRETKSHPHGTWTEKGVRVIHRGFVLWPFVASVGGERVGEEKDESAVRNSWNIYRRSRQAQRDRD